jgi:ABC-2 type transport system permease protein
MKTVLNFLKANFKQFFRDKTALFFTFAFPVIFILIFGLVFSNSDNFNTTIGLVNNNNSQISQGISQAFHGISAFTVKEGTLEDELAALKKGDRSAVIAVPDNLQASIASGQPAEITVYYDPSQTTVSQVVMPIISRTIDAVDKQITLNKSVLVVKEESIQSRAFSYVDYLIPGIIAMSIMMTGLYCALPLIQQREKKILKRLGAMPVRRSALIYSQVAFRLVLAVMQTALLIAIAYLVFHVSVVGNWFVLAGFVVLGTLAFVCLGYLVASFVRTEEGALPVVQLIQFPMLFLSGIFFPVDALPNFMKPVLQALPLSYLGDSFRQVMVDSAPFHALSIDAIVLVGWVAVCMVLSIKFFRWE